MAVGNTALAALVAGLVLLAQAAAQADSEYALIDVPLARTGKVAATLSAMIQCPTVGNRSANQHVSNPAPFRKMHETLAAEFPQLYEVVKVETFNGFSLLYTWEGSDPSLRPLLLISHQDVVPAPTDNWTVDPFSGHIDDEFIWGRGTLDTKGSGIAILEAWEQLRSQGWTPTRTVLFGFGHDEELGGHEGALKISHALEERYPNGLEMILDEGGFTLSDGLGPQMAKLLSNSAHMAAVGLAEKGKASWKVSIRGAGGHSSMPPAPGTSTTATLGKLLTTLNERDLPARLQSPTSDFLKALAPHIKYRAIGWLLAQTESRVIGPILSRILSATPLTSMMIRTAHGVVGAVAGGDAGNVMPTSGSIAVDFRLLAHGGDEVAEYMQGIVDDLKLPATGSVRVAPLPGAINASAITPASGPRWEAVRRAILETVPRPGGPPVLVLPYLMSAGTDSKNYERLARERIFRYEPFVVANRQLSGIHGVDERIAIESYTQGIKFYIRFTQLVADGAFAECAADACPDAASA